jgi:hypothetical protein
MRPRVFLLVIRTEGEFGSFFFYESGLPDGCKPKSQFGYILGLEMDNVGIFYGQL